MAELPTHSFSRKITISKKRALGSLRDGRSDERSTPQHQHQHQHQHPTLFMFSPLPDLDSRLLSQPSHTPGEDVCDGPENCPMVPLESETAVQAAVYTIAQVKPEEPCKREMEDYTSKVFSLSVQTIEEQYKKAAEILQKSDVKLVCTLANFEQDTSPDANSSNHWFCVLGILSNELRSSKTVVETKKNLEDWRSHDLVGEVFTSADHPQNETIQLPVHNLSDEWLVIEVWNKEYHGLQKIRNLLNKREYSFVGRVFCKLQSVSSQSEAKRLELCSHTGKHTRGYLQCSISIKRADVMKVSLAERLREHRALLSSVVLHECKQMSEDKELEGKERKEGPPQWDAQLNPVAKDLLQLHAEFCSLTEFQRVALQFSVLFNYRKHCKPLLHPTAFEHLLDTIAKLPLAVVPSDKAESDLRSELFKNLQDLWMIILKLINNHLVALDINNPGNVTILKNNLMLTQKLCNNKAFVDSLPEPDRQSLDAVIETAIRKSTAQWCTPLLQSYSKLAEQHLDMDAVDSLRGFTKHCFNQCERVQEYLVPFFQKQFHVNYFNNFFLALDEQLRNVAAMVAGIKVDVQPPKYDQTLVSLYEVYTTLQRIRTFCKHVDTSIFERLELRKSYLWFEAFVPKWIKFAMARCKERIMHAVQEDKVVKVTNEVSYSSSLVDTVAFLGQMVEFWKNVDWPNPEQSYGFLRFLVTCIIEAALYYVDLIYQKTLSIGMATATTELCIVLNNMQEMRNRLVARESTNLMEDLQLEKFFTWLDANTAGGLGGQARGYVRSLVDNAEEDIGNKIVILTEQLGQNFISSIRQQLKEVITEMGVAPLNETEEVNAVMHPLEQYLDNTLSTLSGNLFYDIFRLLLSQVWTATIKGMAELTLGQKMGWKSYGHLYVMLQSLHTFFCAEEQGLTGDDLETEEYKAIYNYLKIHRLPTEKLILSYCESLAEDQEGSSRPGDVSVSAAYVDDQVEVVLLNVSNVQPVSARRKSTSDLGVPNLYAQLFVIPEEHQPTRSTHSGRSAEKRAARLRPTHKSDTCFRAGPGLHPLSETLYLPVKHYGDGTVLVIRICQRPSSGHGKDEFVGNCAISMKAISGTKRDFSLHFLHPKESAMFTEIRSRGQNFHDKTAAKFIESLTSHSILPSNGGK